MTLSDEPMKTAIGSASEKWGWFVALGVLLLILGVIALGNLFVATIASVYFIGWLMLLAGVIEIVSGLSPGDRVIVAGHLKLRGESPRVNAVVPAPAPAASAR